MPPMESFRIEIPQSDLLDLRHRLERTRFADDFSNADWGYGVEGTYLRELTDYWINEHDWRKAEARINSYPNFRVILDDVPIHFLHVRGKGPAPTPLILPHGWPWTFWDFRKVIEPLTDPASFGGDPADAFDVVVPSLPGFGFSAPLRRTGMTPPVIAALWVRLMQDVLGYGRFGIHGGDWGAIVGSWLAHAHADALIGAHFAMPAFIRFNPFTLTADDFGPDEAGWYERTRRKRRLIDAHTLVHTRDPQTLAWALNDSPVGLMAWLLERRRAWSDCGGDVETRFSKDDLITATEIYWFTQTFSTSARLYADTFRHRPAPAHDRTPELEAPTAIAVFPEEVITVPRAVAASHANLVQWTLMPRGGHFAAFEEPELVVGDIVKLFRSLA